MLVLKFTKTSTSALAAHVDTLRAVTYLLRRAQLDVAYSQGYNPHIDLGFSPPLPLGVESYAEYVSAKADYTPDVLARVNAVCPKGMSFTAAWDVNVNLAAKINRAEYVVYASGIGNVIDQILAPNYTITYIEKGEAVHKDVSARIFGAERIGDDEARMTLAVGNENLRPDRVVNSLLAANGLDEDYRITKVNSYVDDTNADDFLTALQAEQSNK